jgi:23S rRNA (adenine2503-C2)-methyltransferase
MEIISIELRENSISMELLGKSREELRNFCVGLAEPAYRGEQIYHALYSEKAFAFSQMTSLPKVLRETLERDAAISLPSVRQRYVSRDGSVRLLLGLAGTRNASAEAVFMPSERRQTICISTQAGCAVDCQFCLTAQLGLIRNLSAGEIIGQILVALLEAGTPQVSDSGQSSSPKQTNVVLMGQGEPLLNFENVMGALRIMLDPEALGLSPKHVTLSTSGIVPGIERLGREAARPKLAISLNASNDAQRDKLMPINRKYPLEKLLAACQAYPLRSWEHLTFEYVMLGGVNDAEDDARRLARLLVPFVRVKVNLIPWNPGELPFDETSESSIEMFRRILNDRGVPAFVRYSRGRDVMAACGQLALKDSAPGQLTVLS